MQDPMRYNEIFLLNESSGYNTAQIRDLERRAHQKAARHAGAGLHDTAQHAHGLVRHLARDQGVAGAVPAGAQGEHAVPSVHVDLNYTQQDGSGLLVELVRRGSVGWGDW